MNKKLSKISIIIAVIFSAFFLSLPLSGCIFDNVVFSKDVVSMHYGQVLDLDGLIKTNGLGVYSLSADEDGASCVQIVSHSKVKAIAIGTARIKAELDSGKSDTITINVTYAKVQTLSIVTEGALFQKLGETTSVSLKVTTNDGKDPSSTFDWYIGSTHAKRSAQFDVEAFDAAGTYKITAKVPNSEMLAEVEIRVYDEFDASFSYLGETSYDDLIEIRFDIQSESMTGNPPLFAVLYQDEKPVVSKFLSSQSDYLNYLPTSAGIHKYSIKINDEFIAGQEGKKELSIGFKGVILPQDLKLDFDTFYPKIMLQWNNPTETFFSIRVKNSDNGKEKFLQNIPANSGGTDISAIFDVRENSLISVKSQGNGQIYLESEYVSISHSGISKTAEQYLSDRYLDANHYMSSDEEVYDFFEYMQMFRPYATSQGSTQTSVETIYFAYTSSQTTSDFLISFKYKLTITGNYKWSIEGSTKSNQTMKITIVFEDKNEPENFDVLGKEIHQPLIAPTFFSGGDFVLPAESYPLSPSLADNSNELFYTLEKGLKPLLQQGSTAERLYSHAKEILDGILQAGLSDVEIARAIYDYIMFVTSYDYESERQPAIGYSVIQPAFYLEGVLDTGFAVCDGIAKTYSLLMNMAGIDCIRVIGVAYSGSSSGQHAWNKVNIDGEWYIADATWDIAKHTIYDSYARATDYKLCAHEYFLIIDGEGLGRRVESGKEYPATSKISYDYLKKNNQYISDISDLSDRLDAIVAFLAANRNNLTVTLMGKAVQMRMFAFEYKVGKTLSAELQKSNNILSNKLRREGLSNQIIASDSNIIIAVS